MRTSPRARRSWPYPPRATGVGVAIILAAGRQGFDGKVFDNPALIDVVNTAYSPDAEDIAWAHRVQAAKAEAPPNGLYFVDGAHCDMAYEALADRILGFERAMEARERAGPRL